MVLKIEGNVRPQAEIEWGRLVKSARVARSYFIVF